MSSTKISLALETEIYQLGYSQKLEAFLNLDSYLKIIFIRGLFDRNGSVSTLKTNNSLTVSLNVRSFDEKIELIKNIVNFLEIPYSAYTYVFEWYRVNALDFLGKIYENSNIHNDGNYKSYLSWCSSVFGLNTNPLGVLFQWAKTDERAVAPSKSRISDSGYDLTIIDVHKKLSDVTTVYTTGIKIQAMSNGWYFDMVPRSSIIKTGYILSNMVGVIDRGYTGTIFIALTKVDPQAKDLELPIKIAQLIPRPIVHSEIVEVKELEGTDRGEKGFGSSGR